MLLSLFVEWDFNPVFVNLGGLEIRYYGLMWALAIFMGAKFFDYFCKNEGIKPEVSESIFVYGTLATVLGARIGHCIFYEPEVYLVAPWKIFTEVRNGGMASHGAAMGLLLGLWLFSRRWKLPYIWSLDRIMVPVAIGGAAVRFGNLFNSEIFGEATTMPWGFKFLRSHTWNVDYAPLACHPTQLYEALCYIVTFVVLYVMYFKRDAGRKRPGAMFGVALQGVFLTRFLLEFIKTTQVDFEDGMILDMGQWLSIPFVILGFFMIYRAYSPTNKEQDLSKYINHYGSK